MGVLNWSELCNRQLFETAECPKFRRFAYRNGEPFYLSEGVVLKNGEALTSVSRWNVDRVFRAMEDGCNIKEATIHLPTLYDIHYAAGQDSGVKASVFSYPHEWLVHLILNPNAPTERLDYVLMDNDERVLEKSGRARVMNPIIYSGEEGDRKIIVATVFDLPFELQDGRYNPDDLDTQTGFLSRVSPRGKYAAEFARDEKLYAVGLEQNGSVRCILEPFIQNINIGFRAWSDNPPTQLIESEK